MNRKRCITSLATSMLITSAGVAQSIDICTQTATLVNHPAQFVIETIKKGGLICAAIVMCCSPLWVTNPVCYVTRRKNLRDAFTETIRTVKCEPKALVQGLKDFVGQRFTPTGIIASPTLLTAYDGAISANIGTGHKLPGNVENALKRVLVRPDIPFNKEDVERARWKKRSDPAAAPLFPEAVVDGETMWAITHRDLIIVNTDIVLGSDCQRYAKWAHELTHVAQYRKDGQLFFVDRYLRERLTGSYRDISYEREAYAVEALMRTLHQCG